MVLTFEILYHRTSQALSPVWVWILAALSEGGPLKSKRTNSSLPRLPADTLGGSWALGFLKSYAYRPTGLEGERGITIKF